MTRYFDLNPENEDGDKTNFEPETTPRTSFGHSLAMNVLTLVSVLTGYYCGHEKDRMILGKLKFIELFVPT